MFRIRASGLGVIYDDNPMLGNKNMVESPVLTREANKSGSLTFNVKGSGFANLNLEVRKTKIWVSRDTFRGLDEMIWAGQVIEITKDSYNDLEVVCEGALGYLNDTYQPSNAPYLVDLDQYFKNIINYHNRVVLQYDLERAFVISDITMNADYSALNFKMSGVAQTSGERSRESTFDTINDRFINEIGGQIRLRHAVVSTRQYLREIFEQDESINPEEIEDKINAYMVDHPDPEVIGNYIDYINAHDTQYRELAEQEIEFGKNLISITKRIYSDDFATILIPFGKSLEPISKSWPYYTTVGKTKVKVIDEDPTQPREVSLETGKYIDSENGTKKSISNSNYAVLPDILVENGDSFFLSTHMEGPSTDHSAVTYAIFDSEGNKLTTGSSVRKSKKQTDDGNDEDGKVTVVDQQISILENGHTLRIGVYFDSDSRVCALRKINPLYTETNYSLMSYEPTPDDYERYPFISKPYTYPFGSDVYPSSVLMNVEIFERARMLAHRDLVQEFGPIVQTVSYNDAYDIRGFFIWACDELKNMSEKIDIEIRAADLSYIDKNVPPFELLDLVHVASSPHALNVQLPIMKIELPLDAPQDADYTLSNEVKARDGSPLYMSQYVAETYKKG